MGKIIGGVMTVVVLVGIVVLGNEINDIIIMKGIEKGMKKRNADTVTVEIKRKDAKK